MTKEEVKSSQIINLCVRNTVGFWECLLMSFLIHSIAFLSPIASCMSFLSAIIFYTMPTLSWLIFSTKVDLGYTLFELSFWILFVKWIKSHNRRYLFISAIFLGFAIGSKYHSLIALSFAIIAGLVILIMNKRKFKYVIFTVFIFGLVALAIGSPSYIKNYIYTNDPVYPFITNPSTGSHEEINQYHGILDYIRFQYNMIFNKDYIIKRLSEERQFEEVKAGKHTIYKWDGDASGTFLTKNLVLFGHNEFILKEILEKKRGNFSSSPLRRYVKDFPKNINYSTEPY